MKLFKGDIIKLNYGYNYQIRGKVLNSGGNFEKPAHVLCFDGRYKGQEISLGCFNYEIHVFTPFKIGAIDTKRVKLIKPGWERKHRKSLWGRLVYLFTNKF